MAILSTLHFLDWAALLLLAVAWIVSGWLVEHPVRTLRSTSVMMRDYRQDWMRELVTRQQRVFDSAILSSLRQGATFFASSLILIIGGCLAMIGDSEKLSQVAVDLTVKQEPAMVWEARILLILVFLVYAFLKFTWSHRLFGYCAVLMASVPNDHESPNAYQRAEKAADINTVAAHNFNGGTRSLYFAVGSTSWLFGAVPLMLGTAVTLMVVWWHEFGSCSRDVLSRPDLP